MKSWGFTLVEVLIVVGIATVVASLLVVIIANSAGLFYKQSAKVGQGLGVNDALAKFRQIVKESNSIATGYPSGPTPTYTTTSTQVVLTIPSTDTLGNIKPDVFDYYVFHQDQDKLKMKIFPDIQSSRKSQDQILATNVNRVLVHYLDSQNPPTEVAPSSATKIKMTINLRQKSGADYEEQIATSEASLRND